MSREPRAGSREGPTATGLPAGGQAGTATGIGGRCRRSVSAIVGWIVLVCIAAGLPAASCLLPAVSSAAEIVFLEDGRTIQADKTEIIGDRVRIEKPAETIELPRSAVLSIHRVTPPTASPNVPPPAEVYRDLPQQMTDKVRREIKQGSDRSGGR